MKLALFEDEKPSAESRDQLVGDSGIQSGDDATSNSVSFLTRFNQWVIEGGAERRSQIEWDEKLCVRDVQLGTRRGVVHFCSFSKALLSEFIALLQSAENTAKSYVFSQ